MSGFAKFTNTDDNAVFNFPYSPSYISLFPEGEGHFKEGEYVLSVDESGDYVAGGKIRKYYPTSDVGKKIVISGSVPESVATAEIDPRWKAAKVMRFEARRFQKTYDYYVQMGEPKWTGTAKSTSDGSENLQYTIELWIQYVEE
jgi:hypothetical protein